MNILQINASARRDNANSTKVANSVVERLKSANPPVHCGLVVSPSNGSRWAPHLSCGSMPGCCARCRTWVVINRDVAHAALTPERSYRRCGKFASEAKMMGTAYPNSRMARASDLQMGKRICSIINDETFA